MRTFAIGDIHGHVRALQALLESTPIREGDRIVFLGDYVDKGPDVSGTLEYLMALRSSSESIFLRGNHDQMMIDARFDRNKQAIWECLGGDEGLTGYGDGPMREQLRRVPTTHWDFLEKRCVNFFETPEVIFVHGGLRPNIEPRYEDTERLQWMTLSVAEAHQSGRLVVCGHSAQRSGSVADLGHTICIDTGIAKGGWLTCMAIDTFEFWQASAAGEVRGGRLRSRTDQ